MISGWQLLVATPSGAYAQDGEGELYFLQNGKALPVELPLTVAEIDRTVIAATNPEHRYILLVGDGTLGCWEYVTDGVTARERAEALGRKCQLLDTWTRTLEVL